MKKLLGLLSIGLLLAVDTVQAGVILDLPTMGVEHHGETVVTTSQEYLGATFDIAYTLEAIATSNNPFAYSNGSMMGVGSDGDAPTHYTTIEGNDGEGLSFTSLSIINFNANGSGVEIGDITDLRFAALHLNNVGNTQDGITVSFTDYSVNSENYTLDPAGTGGINGADSYGLDLTALGNYDFSATGLYIETDNASSANRWGVTGLEVMYAIPEPSTLGLIAVSGFGLLFLRRTFMR